MMHELVKFVLHSGLVSKTVLIILFFLSLICWTITFEKIRQFISIKRESDKFLRLFKLRANWNDLYRQSRDLLHSPFPLIFRKFYSIMQGWVTQDNQATSRVLPLNDAIARMGYRQGALKSELELVLADKITELERWMMVLSTTVSVSPFLGLLGTVWGIMTAFLNMGLQHSADLTAVGPGIAEALITTVAGLFVAIPTLVVYNLFVDRLHRLETDGDTFITDLVLVLEREKLG
ncbi:MotA/TolQ/ExbB proton channel family protein [candidate division KSB1 bacterium]|nr:MotA/TolQ/ExbB proton channel family protein [candidate division KSB1 bacterium]